MPKIFIVKNVTLLRVNKVIGRNIFPHGNIKWKQMEAKKMPNMYVRYAVKNMCVEVVIGSIKKNVLRLAISNKIRDKLIQ